MRDHSPSCLRGRPTICTDRRCLHRKRPIHGQSLTLHMPHLPRRHALHTAVTTITRATTSLQRRIAAADADALAARVSTLHANCTNRPRCRGLPPPLGLSHDVDSAFGLTRCWISEYASVSVLVWRPLLTAGTPEYHVVPEASRNAI
jgi:hypothetical protein